MGPLGAEDHGRLAKTGMDRAGRRLLESNLHAVKQRPRAAEGEHAAGLLWVISNQGGGHRRRLDLRDGDATRRLVTDEIRVVDERQRPGDDAWNGRCRHDVDLRGDAPK